MTWKELITTITEQVPANRLDEPAMVGDLLTKDLWEVKSLSNNNFEVEDAIRNGIDEEAFPLVGGYDDNISALII
jgi:hypothetical protein